MSTPCNFKEFYAVDAKNVARAAKKDTQKRRRATNQAANEQSRTTNRPRYGCPLSRYQRNDEAPSVGIHFRKLTDCNGSALRVVYSGGADGTAGAAGGFPAGADPALGRTVVAAGEPAGAGLDAAAAGA
jgi:hypothetical protein